MAKIEPDDEIKEAWVWSEYNKLLILEEVPIPIIDTQLKAENNMDSSNEPEKTKNDFSWNPFTWNPKLRRGGLLLFITLGSLASTSLALIFLLIGSVITAWGYNPELIEETLSKIPYGNYVRRGFEKIEELFA
jgi:hypothetical protein